MVITCPVTLFAESEGRNEGDSVLTKKQAPEYILNAPLSAGAGFLGLGLGTFAGVIVSIPFCLGDTRKSSCSIPSTVAVYAGSSLGMSLFIDLTSRKFGLRHRTIWSVIGGFVGNSGFAYLWKKNLEEGDHSGSPMAKYGVLAIVGAIVVNLTFVYISSLNSEKKDVTLGLNFRNFGSEAVFGPTVAMRF